MKPDPFICINTNPLYGAFQPPFWSDYKSNQICLCNRRNCQVTEPDLEIDSEFKISGNTIIILTRVPTFNHMAYITHWVRRPHPYHYPARKTEWFHSDSCFWTRFGAFHHGISVGCKLSGNPTWLRLLNESLLGHEIWYRCNIFHRKWRRPGILRPITSRC